MKYRILAYNHGLVTEQTYSGQADSINVTIYISNENEIEVTTPMNIILTGNERIKITGAKVKRTIVIHKSNMVYCDRSYVPQRYMNINQDFFGCYGKDVNKHNVGYVNTFSNVTFKSILSYPVSGIQGEQSFMAFDKIFESTIIEMASIVPDKAVFKTDYQYSEYDFTSQGFSMKPQYINETWYFPIPPSILKYGDGTKEYLKVNRNLQGRNLVTSIYFTPSSSSNKNIFVRSSITNFKVMNF